MPSRRVTLRGILLIFAASVRSRAHGHAQAVTQPAQDKRVPLAVLGDSDSHAYHDDLQVAQPHERGGTFRRTTFQWTEVLAQLRGDEIDLGPWGVWGFHPRIAAVLAALGLDPRAPRKRDHRFNFAISGAGCADLNEAPFRQTAALLHLMRRDLARWARGVVVIRIGVNSVGTTSALDAYARTALDARAVQRLAECIGHIARSMALIRFEHPGVHIVVCGISDELQRPEGVRRWPDPTARRNIALVLEHFERQLDALAAADSNAVFFSDRLWFRTIWQRADERIGTLPGTLDLGGAVPVVNDSGDHPRFATLADGHAGTVQNGLWARALVVLLRQRFALRLRPIEPQEIASLADPTGEFGISTVQVRPGSPRGTTSRELMRLPAPPTVHKAASGP